VRDVRRGYADGPFGQIHYRDHGTGRPLVLLHQAPMSSRQFDAVYRPLAARALRPIGIDMPGFGGSDGPENVPTIADYGRCVVRVLDALGIGQAALLGHHTGALAATEAVLAAPGRFDALILNGPLPLSEDERADYWSVMHPREKALLARAGGGHLTDVFARRELLAAGTIPPERISEYVVAAFSGASPFWHGHHAAYIYRHENTLRLLPGTALILTNTGDPIYPHALRAHAIRPDFAFAALEGGGIDIVDQQPDAWSDAVCRYLERTGGS
jgi:pimeloyl-ACP methyl ester carboxylesterase